MYMYIYIYIFVIRNTGKVGRRRWPGVGQARDTGCHRAAAQASGSVRQGGQEKGRDPTLWSAGHG